jgi:hypothetical protein
MVTIKGKHGVKATILKDSISPDGIRLLTYEIEYPRLVMVDLNTHGMLTKNSASSRAIPFEKMAEEPHWTAHSVRTGQPWHAGQGGGVQRSASPC